MSEHDKIVRNLHAGDKKHFKELLCHHKEDGIKKFE